MGNNEKDLSNYIDSLNAEKKPKEHEHSPNSPELQKLYETVRLVRGLKEPALPDDDYPKKLAGTIAARLSQKTSARRPKFRWCIGIAAIAAIVVMAVMLNFISPFNNTNIAYAMEKAFDEVKAYHGYLDIVQSNAQGKVSTQAKLEVWADKEGNYYVKELEGSQQGLITVNNGSKKWQVHPLQMQVHVFEAFPDPYRFVFELGKEVEEVKNALNYRVVGDDAVSGRQASILEISPQGGVPYRIWIDKETRLPLKKQSGMQNALQYTVTYSEVEFADFIPEQLTAYSIPDGFKEIDTKPLQVVTTLEEAQGIAGFTPGVPQNMLAGYRMDSIAVETVSKIVKLNYSSQDKGKRIVVLESKAVNEFKPASTAVLGRVGKSTAEIQSPIQEGLGVLGGGGPYAGVTDINSIRWQQGGLEYAVVGNASLEELVSFVKGLTNTEVQIQQNDTNTSLKPQIEVPVDMTVEENDQKSADAGHSAWKLDPAFVAQVFVSLKISPEGIKGEYPIGQEDLKITKNNGNTVVIEVSGEKTPVRRVYLKRLVRQDSTGIWTVAGYDPVDKK